MNGQRFYFYFLHVTCPVTPQLLPFLAGSKYYRYVHEGVLEGTHGTWCEGSTKMLTFESVETCRVDIGSRVLVAVEMRSRNLGEGGKRGCSDTMCVREALI